MVSISKARSAESLIKYHSEELAAVMSNYFTQTGELKGEWYGEIARVFGLEGQQVKEIHFARLCRGQHPLTGEQLIKWRDMKPKELPAWAAKISSSSPEQAKKQLAKREAAWKGRIEEIYLQASAENDPISPYAKNFVSGQLKEVPKRRFTAKNPPQLELTEVQAKLVEIHEAAAAIYRENLMGAAGQNARAYLENRGVTPELMAEFGLGLSVGKKQLAERLSQYDPELLRESGIFYGQKGHFSDRFNGRLIFPIHDERRRTLAFAGRSLDESEPAKYLNSPETLIYKKSNILYNLGRAKDAIAEAGQAVLVEGYMDVIAAHASGVRNVVADCGTALTDEMVERLGELTPSVVLNNDGDQSGIDATKRHAPALLEKGMDVSVLTLIGHKDASDMLENDGLGAYRNAVDNDSKPVMDWLITSLRQQVRDNPEMDIFQKADAMKDVLAVFQSVHPDRREEFADNWSRYLHVPVAEKSAEKAVKKHRAGIDLTFSAPKSVSVTGLVGGDWLVVEAHRSAVRETLTYAEQLVQARGGGNKAAQTTGKWIIAAFDHDTSRPVDGYSAAQLHTHCVMMNMTEDATGKARSTEASELFQNAKLMTAIYRTILHEKLAELGYQVEWMRVGTRENYAPEIVGYTEEYLASESKREARITAEVKAAGMVGAGARQVAATASRESKIKQTPEQKMAAWKENAERFGNQPHQIVEAVQSQDQQVNQEWQTGVARKSVEFARDILSDTSSVFEYADVVTIALNHAQGRCSLLEVEQEFSRQKEAGEFERVYHVRPNAPLARFRTPELRENEEYGIVRVLQGQGTMEPLSSLARVDPEKLAALNDDQRAAAEFVDKSTDQAIGLRGRAGSGKNRLLEIVNEMGLAAGYEIHGLGTTSRARKGLKAAKIDAETLQKFLVRTKDEPSVKRMFIMDETSLADGRQTYKFFNRLRPQDRIIFSGDERQHNSVGPGRFFWQIQQAGMRCTTLSKIVRQKDEGLLKAVESLARGDVKVGVQLLDEQKRITTVRHRGKRFDAIARDYASDPIGCLVVSPDNQSRKELNAALRTQLRAANKLGEDVYRLNILVNRNNIRGRQREVARHYQENDVILYRNGSPKLGLKGGSYATVLKVDAKANTVTVKCDSGKVVTYDPEKCSGVTIYEVEVRNFAIGDRIQFTGQHKTLGVDNRDNGTIMELDEAGNAVVQMDEGGSRRFNLKANKHVEHGYVSTSHASQGDTVRRVLIHVDTGDSRIKGLITDTFAYVATSRAWWDARIYTDDASKLVQELSRHEAKHTAIDIKTTKAFRRAAAQGMVA